jgi:poly(beta-D-mannuronate) lyase
VTRCIDLRSSPRRYMESTIQLSSNTHLRQAVLRSLAIGLVLVSSQLLARDIQVTSIDELRSALSRALPGDKIIVANGAYINERPLNIACAGTKQHPIEICAQAIGGVEIKGASGFTFSAPAAYVILRGFKFTHQAGTVTLPEGTHHCQITRNIFELKIARSGSYLVVAGDDHEIEHNTFQNKKTEGKMLEVAGPKGPAMAQRTWIHHNYFFNFENSHRNNSSALHIGHSSRSLSPAHSLVEHNLFVKTRGENEGAICNKSCDNVYRFNTFGQDCTELSLRHGNRCLVYGNFFIGTHGGLRIFGDDHKIFCNYFEHNHPAIQIGNGDGNVPPDKLTSHDRPDRVQLFCNTLIGNDANVVMIGRKGGLGATNLIFAHNMIQGGERAVSINGPLRAAIWKENILWKTSAGDIPPNGYQSKDPGLAASEDDHYRLMPTGAANCQALCALKEVNADIDWKKVDQSFDVGADHLSSRASENRSLTPADVGPTAP